MQKNNIISYEVKKCQSIIGGLNFQLVTKTDNYSEINLEKIDYKNSISVSEYAFAFMENIFTSEKSMEERKYYHWGFHCHDVNSVNRIILKLVTLSKILIEKEKIIFLSQYADLIKNSDELEVTNQGLIKLAWSTDEMKDELIEKITEIDYRKQVLNFINEMITFLTNGTKVSGYQGIYVLGI